jgi:thymidine kinase
MIPIEDIRKNYEKYDDATILKIISGAKGLRKEVVTLLNDEIKKRNLDIGLIEFVAIETNFYEGDERAHLINEIKNSVCTHCNNESELHGYTFNTIRSYLIWYDHEQKLQIICSTCAKSLRLKSMLTTLALGWWSRPGIFGTPATLISDLIEIFRKEKYSQRVIDHFIDENTGSIRRMEKGKGSLTTMIKRFNQKRVESTE